MAKTNNSILLRLIKDKNSLIKYLNHCELQQSEFDIILTQLLREKNFDILDVLTTKTLNFFTEEVKLKLIYKSDFSEEVISTLKPKPLYQRENYIEVIRDVLNLSRRETGKETISRLMKIGLEESNFINNCDRLEVYDEIIKYIYNYNYSNIGTEKMYVYRYFYENTKIPSIQRHLLKALFEDWDDEDALRNIPLFFAIPLMKFAIKNYKGKEKIISKDYDIFTFVEFNIYTLENEKDLLKLLLKEVTFTKEECAFFKKLNLMKTDSIIPF